MLGGHQSSKGKRFGLSRQGAFMQGVMTGASNAYTCICLWLEMVRKAATVATATKTSKIIILGAPAICGAKGNGLFDERIEAQFSSLILRDREIGLIIRSSPATDKVVVSHWSIKSSTHHREDRFLSGPGE